MTDDEVKQWLSVKERDRWPSAGSMAVGAQWLRATLRTLAETRKALATLEFVEVGPGGETWHECHFCDAQPRLAQPTKHEPGCIFATMPRPQAHVAGGRID